MTDDLEKRPYTHPAVAAAGVLALNGAVFTFFMAVALFWGAAAIGLVQLLYVVPALLIARGNDNQGMFKGVLLGAAITGLVNGACCGLLLLGAA